MTKQIVTYIYVLGSALSNGKNHRSIPCSYQKLFKKWPRALYFGVYIGKTYEDLYFWPFLAELSIFKDMLYTGIFGANIQFLCHDRVSRGDVFTENISDSST